MNRPELNNTLRLRFFAQYIFSCTCGDDGEEFEADWDDNAFISLLEAEQEQAFLYLRSISQLSDDEAIEVAKIWRPDRDISYHSVKYGRSIVEGMDHLMIGFAIFGQITDYLRSIGIALPFMGYSVEELVAAGWVRIQEGGEEK